MAGGKGKTFLVFFAVFLVTAPGRGALAGEPTEQLRASVDGVIEILETEGLSREQRRSEVRKIVDKRFNFREMARRSLALHWKKLDAGQREEFVRLYADLLAMTYMRKFERYEDERDRKVENVRVEYLNESGDGKYARVDTMVFPEGRPEIPVEYRLRARAGQWEIYDVVVEGVSLVNNYRSQFRSILRSGTYGDLVERVRKKVDELERGID